MNTVRLSIRTANSPLRCRTLALVFCCWVFVAATDVGADEIRVAVASNFKAAAVALAVQFEYQAGHTIALIPGSTGKHYAQIINGAPYDVFLAADSERPQRLEDDQRIIADSRFTYAVGKLVLWAGNESGAKQSSNQGAELLRHGDFRHLAIANPKLAPYGRAAQQTLRHLGLWNELQSRLVQGENIAQTWQFIASGNAELGFIAHAQLVATGEITSGLIWEVPRNYYQPIEQQAVLLRDGEAARAFHTYLRSEPAMELIRAYGYDTP